MVLSTDLKSTDLGNVFFQCSEDSDEAIMITDHDGEIVYVNPAWTNIFGYSKEEALKQNPRILHSGLQSRDFYTTMWKSILDPNKGVWKGEIINRAKDGSMIPVHLTISPYRNSSGKILGHMSIALDLRVRKKLEAQVLRQDRLASLGLLMTGIAHEVGTPLGTIRGRAEMLLMKQSPESGMGRSLEVILEQVDRVSRLVDGLLRLGRGKSEFKPQKVDINDSVQNVLELVAHNFQKADVKTVFDIPQNTWAWIDRDRFQQILINLLVNSLHAIEEARATQSKRDHRIEIVAQNQKAHVQFFMRDSGCGISRENMDKIFDPFFTTKGIGKGTGLGLSIVAKLLNEMNCQVDVQSEVGVGTSFHLVLPKPNESA